MTERSMRNSTMLLAAAVVCLAIAVAACASPSARPPGGIVDIEWQWQTVTNRVSGEIVTVPDPQDYTIVFRTDGTYSGKADCNRISGAYSQVNGLVLTPDVMTTASCGPDSLSGRYADLLATIVAGGPDGTGNLALESAGGEDRMIFADGGPAAAP